jgi:hypothetical protein
MAAVCKCVCECVCVWSPEKGDAGAGRARILCPCWWSKSSPSSPAMSEMPSEVLKKGSSVAVSAAIKVALCQAAHVSAVPGPLAPPSQFERVRAMSLPLRVCTRRTTTAVRAIEFSLFTLLCVALSSPPFIPRLHHRCSCGVQDGSPEGGPEAKFGSRSQPAEFEVALVCFGGNAKNGDGAVALWYTTNHGRSREYRRSYHERNRPISPWHWTPRETTTPRRSTTPKGQQQPLSLATPRPPFKIDRYHRPLLTTQYGLCRPTASAIPIST